MEHEREVEQRVRAMCEQHGLTPLADTFDAPFSPYIARVRDRDGQQWILKVRERLPYKLREAAVMLSYADTGIVPALRPLDEQGEIMLVEDLGGNNLAAVLDAQPDLLDGCADLLATLHAVPAPAWLMPMREFLSCYAYTPTGERRHVGHPPPLRRRFNAVAARLAKEPPINPVFLHGDLHPWNVVVARDRLWPIDPFGLHGPAAYDVAWLAAHTSDPIASAERLAARYAAPLPSLELWLAWACFVAHSHLRMRGLDPQPAADALCAITPGR